MTAISKTNAWAVGTTGSVSAQRHPQFMHWNGKTWSVYNIPNITKFRPTSVKATAPNNVIYEPTTKVYTLPGPNLQLTDQTAGLAVELDGQRYIVGRLTSGGQPLRFFYWNGKAWATMSVPGNVCEPGFSGDCPLVVNPAMT